jgi:chromosome partitioning protein
VAIKIVFFNHKGGLNNTTTTYNIAWMLAEMQHNVLLVDGDPQCHLTSLLLGDDFEAYYENSDTKFQNIKDGVKVAFEGKPQTIQAVTCFSPPLNKNLYLLAGHANLSEYDAALSFAQNSNNAIATLQNLPGAFNELLEKTAEKYEIDYVLIDLNPGLTAINQNLFLLSDAFIIPTNSDPFSVMALQTLSKVLPRWVNWADRMRPFFEEATYPLPHSKPKFMGELIQRFNGRKGKTAKLFRDNIAEIKEVVKSQLVPLLRKSQMLFPLEAYQNAAIQADFCLAELSDFQGLLPKSNDAGVPIFALSDIQIGETGFILEGMQTNREQFKIEFQNVAHKILKLVGQPERSFEKSSQKYSSALSPI